MKIRYFLGLFNELILLINGLLNLKKNCVTVINFHGIEPDYFENFKLQIKWLNRNYKIITPDEFNAYINGHIEFTEHCILITFDDGFISSYNAIQNFLNPLGIKVLFFIPSMFINYPDKKWKEIISNNFFSGRLDTNNFPSAYSPVSVVHIQKFYSLLIQFLESDEVLVSTQTYHLTFD